MQALIISQENFDEVINRLDKFDFELSFKQDFPTNFHFDSCQYENLHLHFT